MGFFSSTVYYTKTPGRDSKSVLTTAQKNQIHTRYKRYAINRFKKSPGNYDGTGMLAKLTVPMNGHGAFFHSAEYRTWPLLSKKDVSIHHDEREKIAKKAAILIRKAGYKVDVQSNGDLKMWKVKRKK